jgi:hypothetical protein
MLVRIIYIAYTLKPLCSNAIQKVDISINENISIPGRFLSLIAQYTHSRKNNACHDSRNVTDLKITAEGSKPNKSIIPTRKRLRSKRSTNLTSTTHDIAKAKTDSSLPKIGDAPKARYKNPKELM